ncbi:hypothetical protein PC128_g12426 [Phytophthora cactorum]|nr:hypothetical protein PC120_g16706 [Phytophthora cactorum]KAG3052296.1 hypothetical protein PC121_g17343 [Phytophthora cactorum]KAG3187873.1 hypothetical protein PC128_g12426 [Phytophthora cactorum]KAG4048486.1 hypothetical protein PC123_g16199 [Phytophthora cactorum]
MRAPDRAQVVKWLRAAWDGLSKAAIKSGFKRVRLLFDERTVEQADSEAPNVNNELAEILESLSCVDSVVGEVAWDDDVVGRYL